MAASTFFSSGRFGYAIALGATAAATLLRWSLPELLAQTPYLAFYPAVVAAAAFGGLWPGVIATLLSFLCVDLIFDATPGQVAVHDPIVLGRLAIFVAGGFATSVLGGMQRLARSQERRRAAEAAELSALAERERAQLEAIFQAMSDGVVVCDASGSVVLVNEAEARLCGYDSAAEMARDLARMGESFEVAELDGSSVPIEQWPISRVMRGESIVDVELLARRRATGKEWIISFSGVPVKDASGKQVLSVVVSRDITQQKASVDALAASERRLRAFFESEMVGAMFWNVDGRILEANDKFLDMVGYTREDLANGRLKWSSMTPPQYVDRDAFALSELLARGSDTPYEKEFIRKDGSRIPVIIGAAMLGDEGRDGVAFVLDITSRQQAEEALRQSEQRLRATFTNAGVGIIELDAGDRIILANDRICEILGYSREQLIGKTVHELTHPDDRAVSDALNSEIHVGLRERVRYEKRYLKRDGATIWVNVTVSAIRDDEGKWLRSVAVFEDITARKLAQEQLLAAKAAAEAASQAKDHFLAVLSHELRTPLTPVVATLSMMEQRPDLDPSTRDSLRMVSRNVNLEARLIDDLLDITRIARGKVELDRKRVSLLQIIEQAVEVVRPDIDARELHFAVYAEEGSYIVNADCTRMQQVFWNLLRNAVKFTPHGGCVGIRVHMDGIASTDQRFAIAEVHDSGAGMDADALSRIFNAFEQAERSITRQFGGLGLGLTISKALVELHGGTISANSGGKGKGSSFYVRLPVETDVVDAQPESCAPAHGIFPGAQPHAEQAADRPGRRILLVEDHGDTARVLRQLLMRDGHQVERAGDVATALQLASQNRFDLLISDLGLPDSSGLDLIKELRARGIDMPGIALSGYGQESDIERSRAAGFACHIVKPVTAGHLQQTIDRLFAQLV